MTDGREDLIYSLAKSMGVGDAQKNRVSSGTYNTETGTMYCNGHVISRASIEQAKAYFTTQYKKLAERDDEGSKELATIYEVAMESINMVVTPAKTSE
ncbi:MULTISPECIES: hypothetical protein [unclassified Butyrivibrio]|uniref:hypothetical protein n=1 Tax=unclassified Butyrivibrio TaxID=2639466 RepID=UPI0008E4A958|nr:MULTISPECIES: hypothetical protein [unclassified Butyrivibrio]RKM58630.1 hypothetical protein D6856_12825 [Butyrivibrio sp. XB500-5]SFU60489.1 hypothetical protein SAMN02910342_01104 [Butyrivibrio sp. INlla21]